MSLSISGTLPSYQDYSTDAQPAPQAPPKPTASQQLDQLAAAGQSAQEIATTLGWTVAQVQQSLGETTTTTSAAASTAIALAGKLSIQV